MNVEKETIKMGMKFYLETYSPLSKSHLKIPYCPVRGSRNKDVCGGK